MTHLCISMCLEEPSLSLPILDVPHAHGAALISRHNDMECVVVQAAPHLGKPGA